MTKTGIAKAQIIASCLFLTLSGRLWAAPSPPWEPPPEAKELIVLLAAGTDIPTPAEVVDSVGQGRSPWQGLSARFPMRARFGLSNRAEGKGLEELTAHPDSPRARLERYVIFSYPPDVDLEQVKRELASDPHVLHVEENVQISLFSTIQPLFQ